MFTNSRGRTPLSFLFYGVFMLALGQCPATAGVYRSDSFAAWPKDPALGFAIIPYAIAHSAEEKRDSVEQAVKAWNKALKGVVEFREMPQGKFATVFLMISGDVNRCVGTVGYPFVHLAYAQVKTCSSWRDVMHELGHIAGLLHEHQHCERDQYVSVVKENMGMGFYQDNFFAYWCTPAANVASPLHRSVTSTLGHYDFRSLMHYSLEGVTDKCPDSCEVLRLKVALPANLKPGEVGEGDPVVGLSAGDIATIKIIYSQ